jgi:hypothetical protein
MDRLGSAILGVLIVIAATHLPDAYESFKIRARVFAVLSHTSQFKMLVEKNFWENVRLDQGADETPRDSSSKISVDAVTGIITVTLPDDIDGGGKTLTMIPALDCDGSVVRSLDNVRREPSRSGRVVWCGTSRHIRSENAFIRENLGTLHSKYAPIEFRRIVDAFKEIE